MTSARKNFKADKGFFAALLLVSLALNLALIWRIRPRIISVAPTAPAHELTTPVTPARIQDTGVPGTERLDWNKLSAMGPQALREALRNAGCPPETLRLILETFIDRSSLPGLIEQFAKSRGDYWNQAVRVKTRRKLPEDTAAKNALQAFSNLLQERDALLRQLADSDANQRFPLSFAEGESDPRIAFLAEDKRRLTADQRREIFDLRKDASRTGMAREELDTRIAELERAHQTELAVRLTPEELEEYNLRMSRYSGVVQNLYSFQASPAERKLIIDLYEKHRGKPPDAELEKAIGPERYIRFQRAHDEAYENIYKVGATLNLPEQQVLNVFQLKQAAETEAKALRDRQDLATSQKNEMLRLLHEQTLTKVTQELGADGRDLYLKKGGWWINTLRPN